MSPHSPEHLDSSMNAYLGKAVHRCGGRENDVLATMLAHDIEHDERASNVIVVILQGLCDTLPNSLEAGKVDYALNLIFGKDLLEAITIQEIALHEGNLLANDFCHALKAHC